MPGLSLRSGGPGHAPAAIAARRASECNSVIQPSDKRVAQSLGVRGRVETWQDFPGHPDGRSIPSLDSRPEALPVLPSPSLVKSS